MEKRAVMLLAVLLLSIPFASAKAFPWTIESVNHNTVAAPGGVASLGTNVSISSVWTYGWKTLRSCKNSFTTEFLRNGVVVGTARCSSAQGCVKNPGNIPGDEWVSTGCVQYCRGGCWVGPAKPAPAETIMADTIRARLCYQECGGGGSNQFQYDAFIDKKDFLGTVEAADGEKDLGPIAGTVNVQGANLVRVSTTIPGVLLWLGTEENVGAKEASSFTGNVWACADSNQNNICDANEGASHSCLSEGGDWYKGVCCNGAKSCTFDSSVNAICGRTADGAWKWAPLDAPGVVHEFFGCANATVMSDGARFYSCGDLLTAATVPFGDFRTATVGALTHEYYCKDRAVTECAGKLGAFAPGYAQTMGATLLLNQSRIHYCASDGDWTADLDVKDQDSCEAADLGWTGSLCCGEADDGRESYNDPLASSGRGRGGCWNNTYVESGQFSVPGRIINYLGQFFGCRINSTQLLALRESRNPAVPLFNNSLATCGAVLLNAVPGGSFPHAVCNPAGAWEFTDQLVGTIQKGIKWSLFVNTSTIKQFGCCAFDQCWNGTRCQPVDAFYRINDRGFTCSMPRAMLSPGGVRCTIDPSGNTVCIA